MIDLLDWEMRRKHAQRYGCNNTAKRAWGLRTALMSATLMTPILTFGMAHADSVFLDEIIVTAQKREQSLQDVSIAVTAFSGEQLDALNIQDATKIVQFTPNAMNGGLGGEGGPPFLNIRGIAFVDFSNINESSTGLYVDEVYHASQGSQVGQLFDVERVEILRGPQGTLFGRNTTAGLVHYTTRKPTDEFDARGSFQYGQNDQFVVTAAVGGPITEGIRARIAGKLNKDDGFVKNVNTGNRTGKTDALALRGIVQFDLASDWMLEMNGHWSKNDGTSPIHRPFWIFDKNNPTAICGGPVPATAAEIPGSAFDQAHAACLLNNQSIGKSGVNKSDYPNDEGHSERDDWPFEYESWGGYATFTGSFNDINLTSISAYERYDQLFGYDVESYANDPAVQANTNTSWNSGTEQFSQEIRLDGEFNDNTWVLGGYYFQSEQTNVDSFQINPPLDQPINPYFAGAWDRSLVKTQSYAFFGQVDAPITDTITASIGARYTNEYRTLKEFECRFGCAPTATPTIEGQAMTGKAALEWRPMDNHLYYASYSHGFKSGGFNPVPNPAQRGPVREETVDSFEVGAKNQFFDNRVRVNTAIFYYKFKDLQALVGSVDPVTGAPLVQYLNAGDPRTYGAEIEAAWAITDNWETSLGIGLLDTKVVADASVTADGRPLDGNKLNHAPNYSLVASMRYSVPLNELGTLTFQADGRYQDDIFTGVDNDPAEFVEAYGTANLRAYWTSENDQYTVEAFVDNVFNANYLQHIFHQGPSTYLSASPFLDAGFGVRGRPRLWGVKMSVDF